MGDVIEHFMWGYQDAFRMGAQWHGRNLFRGLDQRFEPEVFLVGVLIEQKPGRFAACVEPEEGFWAESAEFEGVVQRAMEILQTYEESKIILSQKVAEQRHVDGLVKRGVREAIGEVIEKSAGKPEGMVYRAGWPVLVDGYLVSVVLGLQSEVVEGHPRLAVDKLRVGEGKWTKVSVSLIDAVMDEYFHFVCGELLKPDPGSTMLAGKGTDEILRAAGQRMMVGVAQRVDTCENQEGREAGLFDACNGIAAAKYEQGIARGRLVLARRDHPSLSDVVVFEKAMEVNNGRGARKMLELAMGNLALHMNAKDIWGLMRMEGYALDTEDLFEVRIIDHHRWELVHATKSLMHVRNGIPGLPRPTLDAERLRVDLRRVFKQMRGEVARNIVALAEMAVKERHGTMLVISSRAQEEARRLESQSFRVKPCAVTPGLLGQLTPIDGAVLLDVEGVCHAIGVILDGLATTEGTSSRGARFNSALRYVTTRREACMALVFSVDGGVDILPNLRPPIRRGEIETRLGVLERMIAQGVVRRTQYCRAVEWLVEYEFYLLPEHCEMFNRMAGAIEMRLREDDPQWPGAARELTANEEMEAGMYYLEEFEMRA